jgi:phage RecT family recombinase
VTTDTKLATHTKTTEPKRSIIDDALDATMEALRKRGQRIEDLTPEGVDRRQYTEAYRFALAQTPGLLKCTPESRLLAFMRAARTGLPVDGAGGLGYIIPYGTEATFVPGYKGLIFLAKMCRLVEDMQPILVHEKDLFEPEEGDAPRILHKPFVPRKRGESVGAVIAAYTRVLLPSGRIVVKGYLDLPNLDRIAAASRTKNGPRQGPHGERMQMKDSVRAAFQHMGVPSGDAFRRLRLALEADTAAETGEIGQELMAAEETLRQSANDRLRERLEKNEPSMPLTLPGEPDDAEKAEILRREMEDAAKG